MKLIRRQQDLNIAVLLLLITLQYFSVVFYFSFLIFNLYFFMIIPLIISFFYIIGSMKAQGLVSFLNISQDSQFPLQNIPFGVFSPVNSVDMARAGTRIGDWVVDLRQMESHGLFNGQLFSQLKRKVFQQPYLNSFMSLSRQYWKEARTIIQNIFGQDSTLQNNQDLKSRLLYKIEDVKLHVPVKIGDYTDFYSSRSHAFNVGSIIRGPQNALNQNWLHIPIGYHGRSSSISISGTQLRRPRGQVKPKDATQPVFSECKRLDFEMEVGAFIGGNPNQLGSPIKVNDAWKHIFGFVLLNDWSFRDFQTWQYVPLGPFTAKNGITTISPWIVTLEALQGAQVSLSNQQPKPLPYLQQKNHISYDINLNVSIKTPKSQNYDTISQTNFKYMYWSVSQQLAHHAVSGCNMNAGDLLGSGTISGDKKEEFGSLLQLTWGGRDDINLSNGQKRKFIENGDSILMTGWTNVNGKKIGFGQCQGTVLPSLPEQDYL